MAGIDPLAAFMGLEAIPLRPRAEIGLADPFGGGVGGPSMAGVNAMQLAKALIGKPAIVKGRKSPLFELGGAAPQYRDLGNLLPRKTISPEDLQGSILMPAIGDRTIAGKELTGIGDRQFTDPVLLDGGMNFMRGPQQQADRAMWANDRGAASTIAKRIRGHAEAGNDVNYVFSPMAPQGSDFAAKTMKAVMQQIPEARISTKAKRAFDEKVREDVPDFPGIQKVDMDWLLAAGGTKRGAIIKEMAKARNRDQGFPDIVATRNALTEPELQGIPTGLAGQAISRADPSGRLIANPSVPHTTYNTQIGGEYLGGLMTPLPREVMFPTFAASRPPGENPSFGDRAFLMQNVSQNADQQWLDGVMRYLQSAPQRGGIMGTPIP